MDDLCGVALTLTSPTSAELESDGPLLLADGAQRAPVVGDRWACRLGPDGASAVFTITAVADRPGGQPGWVAQAQTDQNGANLLAAHLAAALAGESG
jgi:hypothetical protein